MTGDCLSLLSSPTSPPFKIQEIPEVGRIVVATRDIEATELILAEKPAAVGPCTNTPPRCLNCLVLLSSIPESSVVYCDKCNFPFCSEACSRSDVHVNNECATFPYRLPAISDYSVESPQYDCITSLRMLLNKKNNPDVWRQLLLHKDHTEDRRDKHEDQFSREQKVIVGFLLEWANMKADGFTVEEVNMVTSMLTTHSVKWREVGRAMYPTFAFMSHSCNYNAKHIIGEDDMIKVFAQKHIKAGEEICITYTSLLTYFPSKQEKLENIWYFTCSCERCCDPSELGSFTSSVCCPGCPKKGYLLPCLGQVSTNQDNETNLQPSLNNDEKGDEETDNDDDDLDDLLDDLDVNPALFKKPEEPKIEDVTEKKHSEENEEENLSGMIWSCSDCKMTLAGDKVSELLHKTGSSMPGISCNEIARHEAFLAATATMLHPNNFQCIVTKRILSQLYGRGEGGLESLTDAELHRKLSLCRDLLQYISIVDSGYSQFRFLLNRRLCFL